MENLTNTLLIIALFVLRLGVPLLLTLGIAYVLRRLDARWQAEARAQQEPAATAAKVQQRPVQPAAPGAGPMLPQVALAKDSAGLPCWSIKGCTEAMMAGCAACQQPDLPCWVARTRAEGRLPATCKGCDLYQPNTVPMYANRQDQRQEVFH